MLNQHTIDKLAYMRLTTMAKAYRQQMESADLSAMTFDERFGMLVDSEWTARQNSHLKSLIKKAGMKTNACMEDIDYSAGRSLNRQLLSELVTCTWLNRGLNVIVTGATGTGKTFLACALGNHACRHSYTVRYYRVSRLLTDLAIARGDGSFNRLMNELKKVRLLILDDWGINPFGSVEGRDLLEVIEDRCQHYSTLVISQIPVGDWHQLFDDPTVADAVMDRLIHDAYLIGLKGESMRKLKTKLKNDENSKGPIDSN